MLLLTCLLTLVWLLRAAKLDVALETPNELATSTGTTKVLAPGPNDGRIAYVTARMLEQNHYLRKSFDDAVSEKFFDRYFETLDPQHIHFTQADIAEFEAYRTKLDDLTVTRQGVANVNPAYEIFTRFLERLQQRVAYAREMLQHEPFVFDTDERIATNRREAPYPRDLDEAKALWRQRVRYEYLQEKLAQVEKKKTAEATSKKERPDVTETDAPAQPPEATKSEVAAEPKKSPHEEITETLTKRYNRILHTFEEWESTDVLQEYLSALARVYDPHSGYLNASATENFSINMNLSLFGIGAVLTTDLDGYCKVQEVKPGPAMRSGQVKANDRIVAVAQGDEAPVDVVGMNLNKVVQLIRGPKGTEVRLTILPANDSGRKVVSIIRDEIPLEDQAAKAKLIELPGHGDKPVRLGIIDLPSFYANLNLPGSRGKAETKSTTTDVKRLLKKLTEENVSGVILDLRRNGGGSLEEAIRLTGLFIKEGPVVQVRDTFDRRMVDEDDDPSVAYDGPLIVLTSRFSASASEILAGALQDYGRALIVGDVSTHGKGTVQNLNPLRPWVKPATITATNDPGTLKVTIRKFYRAGGSSTQLKGVMPDIVLPSVLNYSKEIGEVAHQNPLEWDTIESARYDKLNLVEPYLQELLRRSSERVATDQDFAYIREDIELFKKRQADRTISLNEAERLRELAADEARKKARETERQARTDDHRVVYEIKLSHVDLPGLPPPVEKTNTATATLLGAASGASTNSASIATKSADLPADLEGEDGEDKAPTMDPTLDEAGRILLDYISLLGKKGMITAKE